MTTTDPAEFRAVQSEAATYQKILDFQRNPALTPNRL